MSCITNCFINKIESITFYPIQGITAVIRVADPLLTASIIIKSSIRASFGLLTVGWIIKTSLSLIYYNYRFNRKEK